MWFYSKDGQQKGPVEKQEILDRLKAGELSSQTLVWKEGMGEWAALGQVEDFRVSPQAASVPGTAEGPPVQPMSQPQAGAPLVAPVEQNGMALASMILGLCIFVSCGLTGFVAVPLGHIARRQIRNSATPQTGDGMALAGLVLGYLGAVGILAYIGFIVVAFVMAGAAAGGGAVPSP